MDVLLFVLGCFGVLPVAIMTLFYGGVVVLLPSLLAVGVVGRWQEQSKAVPIPRTGSELRLAPESDLASLPPSRVA